MKTSLHGDSIKMKQ